MIVQCTKDIKQFSFSLSPPFSASFRICFFALHPPLPYALGIDGVDGGLCLGLPEPKSRNLSAEKCVKSIAVSVLCVIGASARFQAVVVFMNRAGLSLAVEVGADEVVESDVRVVRPGAEPFDV